MIGRVSAWWLHIRSAVRLASLTTLRFAFRVREGVLFSLATALLTFLVSHNLGTSAFGLLSFPVAITAVFLWYSARNLAGWNSLYDGDYRQQFELARTGCTWIRSWGTASIHSASAASSENLVG